MNAALSLGHRPVRKSLVEISGKEANERWMNPGIGADAVDHLESIAMSGRSGQRRDWRAGGGGAGAAGPPTAGARAQRPASRKPFQRRRTATPSSFTRPSSSLSANRADR